MLASACVWDVGAGCMAALTCAIAAGCGPGPVEVVDRALAAIAAGDARALAPLIAADYTDALGDRDALLRDAADLAQSFGRIELEPSEASVSRGASAVEVAVVGRLDATLVGDVRWQVTGPLYVELRRQDGFQVRSGILADLRDVRGLMDARRRALEANDAQAYARLLHPTYRDGALDLADVKARLARDLAGPRIRLEPSLYRLELRGPRAHLDEHYQLTVGERRLPAAVARMTLERAGGRWRIAAGLYPEKSP